jgi:hypothetical protein
MGGGDRIFFLIFGVPIAVFNNWVWCEPIMMERIEEIFLKQNQAE